MQPQFFKVLLLLFTLRARASSTSRRFLYESGLAGVALLVSLLIRNAALAFWPAVLAVLVHHRRLPRATRGVACGLVTALALPIWLAVRAWLGQMQSHPIRLDGGRYGFGEYVLQLVSGIDRNTNLEFVGLPLILLLAASLLRGDATGASRDGSARLGRAALLFVAVAACALLAIFNLTPIADRPDKRFTLFVTLAVGGLGLLHLRALLRRRWLALALVLVFAQPTLRLARHTILGRGPVDPGFGAESLEGFVPSRATIDPGHTAKPPAPSGGLVLVSPPYPREVAHRHRPEGRSPPSDAR